MKLALLSDPNSENAHKAIESVLNAIITSKTSNKGAAVKIGYIASQPDPTREYYQQTQQLYKRLNAELSVYLELESEFSQSSLEALLACDAIHLSGGDTFRFLAALKQRALLPVLRQFVANGGGLIGVSAGAMIMTPNISSAVLCGDNNHCDLTDLTALNLVDFLFAPHISDDLFAQVDFKHQLLTFRQPLCLCADNAALSIINNQLLQHGQPHWSQA